MTRFSLAHLTVLSLPPPDMVRVAARTGYQTVGLRVIRVTDTTAGYPLMDDPPMLRATRSALAETGLGVLDIEFVQLRPETDLATLAPFLEVGGELGARWVVAAPYDPDLERLADRFAALCDMAAPFGMGVVLEFFPWLAISGVTEAHAVVSAAGRPNAGILVDTLHVDRGPSTQAAICAVPASRLPFVHLCDAPAGRDWSRDELLHTARAERLAPGEGGIDLAGILGCLPAGIPVALEAPMTGLAAQAGEEFVARHLREAAVRLIEAGAALGSARHLARDRARPIGKTRF